MADKFKPLEVNKYHFKGSHPNYGTKTCTVRAMREYLAQFPEDMLLAATWETTTHGFADFREPISNEIFDVPCIVFDVEYENC